MLRAIQSFHTEDASVSRLDTFDDDDPIVVGREALFEPVVAEPVTKTRRGRRGRHEPQDLTDAEREAAERELAELKAAEAAAAADEAAKLAAAEQAAAAAAAKGKATS